MSRAARTDPAPKCRACDGWAFERGVTPMKACTACGGTGRPSKQKDMIDG
ncbi:MAG: hypothetical protein ACK40O_00950 [Allosphingosinicella sp.]